LDFDYVEFVVDATTMFTMSNGGNMAGFNRWQKVWGIQEVHKGAHLMLTIGTEQMFAGWLRHQELEEKGAEEVGKKIATWHGSLQ